MLNKSLFSLSLLKIQRTNPPSPNAEQIPIPSIPSHNTVSLPSPSSIISAADLLKLKEEMKNEILAQIQKAESGSESSFGGKIQKLYNPFHPLDFEVDEGDEEITFLKEMNEEFIQVRKKK